MSPHEPWLDPSMTSVDVLAGEVLVEQHDIARTIFAVKGGSIETMHEGTDKSMDAEALTAPETFGESALAAADEVRIRTTGVKAGAQGATVVSWAVSAIETLVGFSLQAASFALNNRKMLQEVRIGTRWLAEGLSKDEMDVLLESMEELSSHENEVITPEGELDTNLYIIRSGEAAVVWTHGGARHQLMTLRRGHCYGEQVVASREAMKRLKRKMSVEAAPGASPIVMLVLTPAVVEELSGLAWFQSWWQKLGEHIAETAVPGVDAIVVHKLTMVAKLGDDNLGPASVANLGSLRKAASVLLAHHHSGGFSGGDKGEAGKEGKGKEGKSVEERSQQRKPKAANPNGKPKSAAGGGGAGGKGGNGKHKKRKSLFDTARDAIMGGSEKEKEQA